MNFIRPKVKYKFDFHISILYSKATNSLEGLSKRRDGARKDKKQLRRENRWNLKVKLNLALVIEHTNKTKLLTIKKLLVDQHANRTLRVVCGILTIIKLFFQFVSFQFLWLDTFILMLWPSSLFYTEKWRIENDPILR